MQKVTIFIGIILLLFNFLQSTHAENVDIKFNEIKNLIETNKNKINQQKLNIIMYYYEDAQFLKTHTNLCSYNPISQSISHSFKEDKNCLLHLDLDTIILRKLFMIEKLIKNNVN